MSSDTRIKQLVILGGGTAGWVAASALAHFLRGQSTKIVLIESALLGSIGVGEATVPSFINFLGGIGLSEQEFIKETNATFKLGIQFRDWRKLGDEYFHPFGRIGMPIGGADFFHCWLRLSQHKSNKDFLRFSPSAQMAEHSRFYPPQALGSSSSLSKAFYALHFDAGLVATSLRKYSEAAGVMRIEGEAISVSVSEDSGFIEKIRLLDGREISGDFFIDCSGFKAFLINGALGAEYESWTNLLPCDRAIALQTNAVDLSRPYTASHARENGWTWQIPLQTRTGNGYVYSSSHCGDEQALQRLQQVVPGAPSTEPRVIPFVTGRRRATWTKNCLALGLASGFLEPLESTAIHLITRAVQFFLRMFPDKNCSPALVNEFNRRMNIDYEEIRDFLVLHYCTNNRTDSLFWKDCQNIKKPETLVERLALFEECGLVRDGVDDLFTAGSWQAVCLGMGIVPKTYQAVADSHDRPKLQSVLQELERAISTEVNLLPKHEAFIAGNCAFR